MRAGGGQRSARHRGGERHERSADEDRGQPSGADGSLGMGGYYWTRAEQLERLDSRGKAISCGGVDGSLHG